MLVVPTASAVTNPVWETVATAVFEELQVTALPNNTLPFTSSVVAVACEVPMAVTELGLRTTLTVATGTGFTVIVGVGVDVTDSLVAVIVALPTPVAVTVAGDPLAVTVSTDVLLDCQVTVRPVRIFPFPSLVVAVIC
jgi:hypothetical protein